MCAPTYTHLRIKLKCSILLTVRNRVINLEVSVSKNKKGIFHSNNGGYLHFDVIVLNRLIFYHESIEVAIDTGKVKL